MTILSDKNEIGLLKGEPCNRDGCNGIIDEHEKEGSCSCHINPPCGYCTTDTAFCPACDWQASDEKPREVSATELEYYAKKQKEWREQRESFMNKLAGKEPIEKLEIRAEGHTHFTQTVMGVFPPGTETRETIEAKAKGTFGGRFTYFGEYSFKYIAYTD